MRTDPFRRRTLRALAAAGHRSIVVAQEGSTVAGALRPVSRPAGTLDDAARTRAQADTARAVAEALVASNLSGPRRRRSGAAA